MVALRSSGWENYPLTYERIKYAALDARVSFEIAARSKELVVKPSPRENENKKKKKKKKKGCTSRRALWMDELFPLL